METDMSGRGIYISIVRLKGKGNYYRPCYSVLDSLKLYDFMYNHPILASERDLFLVRKKIIFDRYLTMRSWCSLATRLPVTEKIAGSNPVDRAID